MCVGSKIRLKCTYRGRYSYLIFYVPDALNRQFDDLVLLLDQEAWDTVADRVNIEMVLCLDSKIAVAVDRLHYFHRYHYCHHHFVVVAAVALVGANLDRNLSFGHALADKVIDLWKYLSKRKKTKKKIKKINKNFNFHFFI